MPTTIEDLCIHLQDIPTDKLPEHVMRFGAHLRGTKAYWTLRRSELTNMITQLQCPTLFFTLSAADTKWPDLHVVMQEASPTDPTTRQQWRTHNIIDMPHTVAAYMHKIFSIFHEEMLQQNMHTTDYWYRYTLYTTYLCLCTTFTYFFIYSNHLPFLL